MPVLSLRPSFYHISVRIPYTNSHHILCNTIPALLSCLSLLSCTHHKLLASLLLATLFPCLDNPNKCSCCYAVGFIQCYCFRYYIANYEFHLFIYGIFNVFIYSWS